MRRATHAIATALVSGIAAAQTPLLAPEEPDVLWRTDVKTLPSHTFDKQRVEFSPDGRWIGVVYQPQDAAIIRATDGQLVRELPQASISGAYSIVFSPRSDRVAVGRSGAVEVLDVASGRSEWIFRCADCSAVEGMSFSFDGSLFAFQGLSGPSQRERQTTVVDLESGRYVAVLEAATNRAHVAFSPNGKQLVASSFHRGNRGVSLGFRVWNTENWSEALDYSGEPRAELGAMASGTVAGLGWVAVYGRSGTLELRTLTTDRIVWTAPLIPPQLAPETSTILGTELDRVELSPDGELLVTYESPRAHDPVGHVSGGIVVRNADDGGVVAVYDIYGVTGLSVAPDSRAFVYATGAGEVHRALVRLPRSRTTTD